MRKRSRRRGSRQIANPRLLATLHSPVRSVLSAALIALDRRRFHMDPLNRPLAMRREDARKVIRGEMRSMPRRGRRFEPLRETLPARLFFDRPHRIDLCIRRKVRREVLLALGRGGGGKRRPRRNEWSDVGCYKR